MIEASRVRAEMGDAAAAEASLLLAHDLAKVAALRSLPQWLADVDEAEFHGIRTSAEPGHHDQPTRS